MNFLLTSSDPQDIIRLLLDAPQHDAHARDWRWECYRAGNYHYWPAFSNKIVYGERKHAY